VAVVIEGISFTLDEAKELAERTRRYVGAGVTPLTPGTTLAVQIEQRLAEGGGTVELNEQEELAAWAVVDEWCQSSDAPAGARDLRRALAPDQT
jgi:hypothetical protein